MEPAPFGPLVMLPAPLPTALVAPYEGGNATWRKVANEATALVVERVVERAARAEAERAAKEAVEKEAAEKAYEKVVEELVMQIVKEAVELRRLQR